LKSGFKSGTPTGHPLMSRSGANVKVAVAQDTKRSVISLPLKFAIVEVGMPAAVRLREVEKYAMPERGEKEVQVFDFTLKRWVLEIYRTVIKALQGIVWVLLMLLRRSLSSGQLLTDSFIVPLIMQKPHTDVRARLTIFPVQFSCV
jgi:hypothetical protein